MTEADRILDSLLIPEYWRGHGFEDSCPWKTRHEINDELGSLKIHRKRLKDSSDFAKEILRGHRGKPIGEVSERFIEGQIFDGSNFQQGTLVRFQLNYLGRHKVPAIKPWNFVRGERTLVGVVTDILHVGTNQRILSAVPEVAFSSEEANLIPLSYPSLMKVGDVDHTRRLDGGEALGGLVVYDSLRRKDDIIERVSLVEVLV